MSDEGNRGSSAYIMAALDRETEELKKNYLDIDIEVTAKQENIKEGVPLAERNQETINYNEKTHDDIVDQKLLEQFMKEKNYGEDEIDINKEETGTEITKKTEV